MAVAAVLAKPEVREKLLAIGLIPVGTTPEELTQELAANTRVLAADRESDGLQDHELTPIFCRIAASSASSQMPIRMPPLIWSWLSA